MPLQVAGSCRNGSNPPLAAPRLSGAAMPPRQPQCGTDGPSITWHAPLQPLQFSATGAPPVQQLPADGWSPALVCTQAGLEQPPAGRRPKRGAASPAGAEPPKQAAKCAEAPPSPHEGGGGGGGGGSSGGGGDPAAWSRRRRSAHSEKDLEEAVHQVPNKPANSGVHARHTSLSSRVSLESAPAFSLSLWEMFSSLISYLLLSIYLLWEMWLIHHQIVSPLTARKTGKTRQGRVAHPRHSPAHPRHHTLAPVVVRRTTSTHDDGPWR